MYKSKKRKKAQSLKPNCPSSDHSSTTGCPHDLVQVPQFLWVSISSFIKWEFLKINVYWSIVDLQCCFSFCCIAK